MKIEAGKYYKTEGGEKVYCFGRNPFAEDVDHPMIVVSSSSEGARTYTEEGSFYGECKSPNDIVEEWKDPAKLYCVVKLCRANGRVYGIVGTPHQAVEYLGSVRVTLVEGEFAE